MNNNIQEKVVLGRAIARLLRPRDASVARFRVDSNSASVRANEAYQAPSKKRREVPFRHRYGIPEVKVMIHAKQTSAIGRPIHPNIFSLRSIHGRHERSHVQRFPNKSAIGFDDNHPYGDSSGGAYAA